MKRIVNFLVFLLLLTYAINQGDLFGMFFAALGFLFMHVVLEDLEDAH
jgi:hypothetical protein